MSNTWLEQGTRRASRILLCVSVVYVALIASHKGDFWPFSVFPMFASAGKPWERALVRELNAPLPEQALFASYELTHLPGAPLPLQLSGVPQHDVSSLVQRAEQWTKSETDALAGLFGTLPCKQPLLVFRVRGALDGAGVHQVATPAALLTCSGTEVVVRGLLVKAPA